MNDERSQTATVEQDVLADLRQHAEHPFANELLALSISPVGDYTLAAKFMGVPSLKDCPSPGEARTWTKSEWYEWAGKHGYQYHGETAHSFMWRHPVANTLVVSVAKTSGDFRAPMAMATDTKRYIRNFLITADSLLRAAAEGKWLPGSLPMLQWSDKAAFIAEVSQVAQSKCQAMSFSDARHKSSEAMAILRSIERDHHLPISQAFNIVATIMGQNDDGLLERMKLSQDVPVGDELIANLRDLRERLAAEEQAEKDIKAERRAKDDAEREARRLNAARPKTAQEVAQAAVQSVHNIQGRAVTDALKVANGLVERLMALQAVPVPVVPAIEDPSSAEIARLKEALVLSQAELKGFQETRTIDHQEMGETKAAMEALKTRIIVLEKTEQDLHALAALVVGTLKDTDTMAGGVLYRTLSSLAEQTREFLPKV